MHASTFDHEIWVVVCVLMVVLPAISVTELVHDHLYGSKKPLSLEDRRVLKLVGGVVGLGAVCLVFLLLPLLI